MTFLLVIVGMDGFSSIEHRYLNVFRPRITILLQKCRFSSIIAVLYKRRQLNACVNHIRDYWKEFSMDIFWTLSSCCC